MKKLLYVIVLFVLFNGNVFADEVYINRKGVSISYDKYEYLLQFFSEEKINNFSQSQFDEISNKEFELIGIEKKNYYTMTSYDSLGEVLISYTREITDEEYEKESFPMLYSTCDLEIDCWETNYKQLVLYAYCEINSVNCSFGLELYWKRMPVTRSYDVFGIRWSAGSFSPTRIEGSQSGYLNGLIENFDYDNINNSNLVKTSNNGAGMSIKLNSDFTTLYMSYDVYGCRSTSTSSLNIFGTYQHAQSSVSLSDSKGYTFSASGLGNVLYYSNSSIRNKYDAMGGVSVGGFV